MTKARPNTGYSSDAFRDIDTMPAPKALTDTGVGDLRGLFPPRPATSEPEPATAEPAPMTSPAPTSAPAVVTQLAAPVGQSGVRRPSSPAQNADRTMQSNMRIPVAMAELLKQLRTELEWSTGELITTAVGELYLAGELADLFSNRQQPGGGGLFQTRASRLPTKTDENTVHSIVSYRLTPADFDTLDRIKDEVGARSRGHLITTAVRAWANRNPST